ncbi:MAG: hypothetical protein K1W21_00950 [Oscillospiraceae bacterium]
MNENKNPHPAGGTAEQGEHGAVWTDDSHNSNFTSGGTSRQGRIAALLPAGEEHAVPAGDLARMAGFSSTRSLRMAVDRERELDGNSFILASEHGYFMPADGSRGIAEMRKFIRRQDSRAASNRRATRRIREYLRAAEKAPLDGQEAIWGGEDT